MYHKVLVSGTEWENFFNLRCPQYTFDNSTGLIHGEDSKYLIFRSRKDYTAYFKKYCDIHNVKIELNYTDLQWRCINKGMAEIHLMDLAECMWDTMNESIPKELKAGDYHIPYGDNVSSDDVVELFLDYEPNQKSFDEIRLKIATARAAGISYTTIGEDGKETPLTKLVERTDGLAENGHWSCFEHCARAMNDEEYSQHISANPYTNSMPYIEDLTSLGWSGNFKGFIQYRKTFKNENITKE